MHNKLQTLITNFNSMVFISTLILIPNHGLYAKRDKDWGVVHSEYFEPVEIDEKNELHFIVYNLNKTYLTESSAKLELISNSRIISIYKNKEFSVSDIENGKWQASVNVIAHFIGGARIFVEIERRINNVSLTERSKTFLTVQVIRKRIPPWMYTDIYTIYEYVLYSIIRILLGMIIEWHQVKEILKNPIGIGISFFTSYIFMPLVRMDN